MSPNRSLARTTVQIGRDIAAWLRLTGWFERRVEDLPPGAHAGQPNPQLTGAGGPRHQRAFTRPRRCAAAWAPPWHQRRHGVLRDDLNANVVSADAEARNLLDSIDRVIETQQLDAPAEDLPPDLTRGGREPAASADGDRSATLELDLGRTAISTVIWATAYRPGFTWVGLPFVDADGYPIQRRGVTYVKGLYVLGLDWLHTAKSGLFAEISDDATYLASVIAA